MLPQTFTLFFPDADWAQTIARFSDPTNYVGMIFYMLIIIGFTYFYSFVQVNPEKVADNLKKQGSYVPGIRPGKTTENYITSVLYRLVFVGSLFLAVIAIIPLVVTNVLNLPPAIQVGGTSLLIVIGVALETMKQLEAQANQREYRGFRKRR